jgi:hypothetical protein
MVPADKPAPEPENVPLTVSEPPRNIFLIAVVGELTVKLLHVILLLNMHDAGPAINDIL